ncbi:MULTISPECIES: hypothetical protein [Microbacterium]|uniref:hypothetical protein n=1 Tax=Microbacterium TaxID=33882 RepID=UPI00217D317E|nr:MULTISPECIES: hypothetical protein [Microbacterium]UWF78453.1 hypothetical protein JSY13_05520 [Microbacterium neungamense]WCM56629.1 hypothetical protein JRG78_05525 [Microbacterium sp. EF45047]
MNTTVRSLDDTTGRLNRSTTHPPDTGDRQILTIPDRDDRQRLTPAERLTLRIGLWLQRSIRAVQRQEIRVQEHAERHESARLALSQREAMILLTYDLQRQLR